MQDVPYYPISIVTGGTSTAQFQVGYSDNILLALPQLAAKFSSASVMATLMGAYQSGATAATCYFYDYANKTPSACVVTITTGGVYEMPHPGAVPYLRVSFSEATSGLVTGQLLTPKTTY